MISQNSLRFRIERAVQFFQRRQKALFQLFRRADVDRGWDHIIARLPHVDVVVRMNRIARADWLFLRADSSGSR